MDEMMKTLGRVFTGIMVAWLVWFAASWIEVCMFNTTTANYSFWNLFEILVK